MHRFLALTVLLALLLGACAPDSGRTELDIGDAVAGGEADGGTSGREERDGDAARRVWLGPRETAERLTRNHENFRAKLAEWQARGAERGEGGWRDLQILGLKQQLTMRRLARHPNLAAETIPLLEGRLRYQARSNVKAAQGLLKLSEPLKPPIPDFPITRAELPHRLKKYYDIAEDRFGVPWYILASVNFIESKFGRFQGPSSAGAEGPMQFMPATWDAYGKGDVREPYNAIMGAARYLKASGAPGRMRDALYAYNHSEAYVDAILAYAREMERSELNLYDYYFWQVFIRTTKGYRQLSGPKL